MTKKTTEEVTKDIMDIEFEDTSKAKYIDDEGYEDGKSKDREMMAEANTVPLVPTKMGKVYKGKAKDYPGAQKAFEENLKRKDKK